MRQLFVGAILCLGFLQPAHTQNVPFPGTSAGAPFTTYSIDNNPPFSAWKGLNASDQTEALDNWWANKFTVVEGGDLITGVAVGIARPTSGWSGSVALYKITDSGGNPSLGAVRLYTQEFTPVALSTNQIVLKTPVALNVGDRFLVAVFMTNVLGSAFPFALDNANDSTGSYWGRSAPNTFNLDDLSKVKPLNQSFVAGGFVPSTAGGHVGIRAVGTKAGSFNVPTDAGWRRYDPLAGVGGKPATFEIKDGAYHLRAPLSPNPSVLGPPRAGAFYPSTEFTDFTVSADIVDWDAEAGTMFGVLARVNNIGIGRSNAYYFRYCSNCRNLEIDYVSNEQGFRLVRRDLTLDPAKNYRLVFTGIGEYLRGDLYDLENPAVPMVTLTVVDHRYSRGLSGLLIANFTLREGDATFDNYVAKVPEEEVPGYATSVSLAADGSAKILFKGNPGATYEIQASEGLSPAKWATLGSRQAGPDRRFEFLDPEAASRPMRLYRLRKN